MSTFWEAISILECTCSLLDIAAVSDGASQIRAFYRMHNGLNDHQDADVVYKTVNLFAPGRYIYIISRCTTSDKNCNKCFLSLRYSQMVLILNCLINFRENCLITFWDNGSLIYVVHKEGQKGFADGWRWIFFQSHILIKFPDNYFASILKPLLQISSGTLAFHKK